MRNCLSKSTRSFKQGNDEVYLLFSEKALFQHSCVIRLQICYEKVTVLSTQIVAPALLTAGHHSIMYIASAQYGFKSRSRDISRLQVYVTCVVEHELDDFSETCEAILVLGFFADLVQPFYALLLQIKRLRDILRSRSLIFLFPNRIQRDLRGVTV